VREFAVGAHSIAPSNNGCQILTGCPDLNVWLTQNCGRSDGTASAFRDISPTDPNPRFIAPYTVDGAKGDHWVIAGQYIWTNAKGFLIQTAAEWKLAYDNGVGRSTTALASRNDVVWSAWGGPCNNDGFARGISTNVGGTFHQVSLPVSVPNRYIDGIAIDALDSSGQMAYVAFNGFSRRWTEGPRRGHRPPVQDDRRRRHLDRRQWQSAGCPLDGDYRARIQHRRRLRSGRAGLVQWRRYLVSAG
jgi:hypothetical protein